MSLACTPIDTPVHVHIDIDEGEVDCPYCNARRAHTKHQFYRDMPPVMVDCDNCNRRFVIVRVYRR